MPSLKPLLRPIAQSALGTALSLTLGAGILAVVVDTVSSAGNSVESGTFASPPKTIDLRLARVARTTDCDTLPLAAYSDSTTMAVVYDDVTLDLDGAANQPQGEQVDKLCLRNFGTADADLVYAFANLEQFEVGDCADTEAAAEDTFAFGDGSCASTGIGELAEAINVGLEFPTGSCGTRSAPRTFASLTTPADRGIGNLAAGEVCTAASAVYRATTTDETLRVAQTDRVTFDFSFKLKEVTA